MSSIAEQFGVTVNELVKINNLDDPDLIIAGEDLKVIEYKKVTVTNLINE